MSNKRDDILNTKLCYLLQMTATKESVTKSFKNSSEEIEKIPATSGLYYLYDSSDTLMYVGKAKSLRSRIKEHMDINNWVLESGISWEKYQKEISEQNRKSLHEKAKQISYDLLSKPVPLVIDIIFDHVKTIEIEEMSFEELQKMARKRILEWQPMYNHETASKEYYEIKGYYYDD